MRVDKQNLEWVWKVTLLVLVTSFVTVVPYDAWAQLAGPVNGNDPFGALCLKVQDTWNKGRKIVYIISGIGALALGVMAFFGRFKWTTFFALCGGIFIIAIFENILTYLSENTNDTASIGCV
jgi:hypothetical protein